MKYFHRVAALSKAIRSLRYAAADTSSTNPQLPQLFSRLIVLIANRLVRRYVANSCCVVSGNAAEGRSRSAATIMSGKLTANSSAESSAVLYVFTRRIQVVICRAEAAA